MSKTPTSHEVWSREQRLKQHEQRMAAKKRSGPVHAKSEVDKIVSKEDPRGELIMRPETGKSEMMERAIAEIETAGGKVQRVRVSALQKAADAVPAKKRGRPKTSTVDRATYQRELMRKKRAAAKEGK